MFAQNSPRFATYAVIESIPGPMIDTVWFLIDQNLTGVFPLANLIKFDVLQNDNGRTALQYSDKNSSVKAKFDIPIKYSSSYPKSLMVYDDGVNQTVMLPNEVK